MSSLNFRVIDVIDGDTFTVSPFWKWNGKEGDVVRPAGFNTPEEGQVGYSDAKKKLSNLISGRSVKLQNAKIITYGRLLCDVYVEGKNLASFFPEYQ